MMTKCPLCGSEIVCSRTPGTIWCTSTECGAVFHDIDLTGTISVTSQEPPARPVGSQEQPDTSNRGAR